MENQESLKPIVQKHFRLQIKAFGDELQKRAIMTPELAYRIAYCMRFFNTTDAPYNEHKAWHKRAEDNTLLDGILMTRAIGHYGDPKFKIKEWEKHVKHMDVADYISRRVTYDDWENEVETEASESDMKIPGTRTVSDIHDLIDSNNAKKALYEEITKFDKQKKFNQIWVEEQSFVIKFNYSASLLIAIKALPGRTYEGERKLWFVPTIYAGQIKEFALAYNFVFHESVVKMLYANKEKLGESYKTSADFFVEGLKMDPYPYQKAGIYFGFKQKKILIADEMGLGKTIQAIGVVISHDAFPCVIVAPKSLLYNWRNEWRKFTKFDPVVYHQTKQDVRSLLRFTDVIIVNYEGVKKLLPYKDLFKSMVVDESHNVKSKSTQRYAQVFELGVGKEIKCLLTGTPIMNRPAELIPQLKLLDMLKDPLLEQKFKSRYCGKGGKGGENLEELNIKLRSSVMIRREKEDVLTDLPDFTRNYIDVDITTRQEYDLAENNFATYLKEVKQFSDRKIRAAMNAEILVRMGILKQISAKGKMEAIKEFMETCFEEEQKVILFAHHREIINEYAASIPTDLTITGQTKLEDRQKFVDRFQDNKDEKAIVLSIRAASVGLTLTAAQIEIFAEFDWNPAMHDQAEARAHRIGQKDHVNAYYFKGTNTIDEDIISLINYKRDMVNRATGTTTEIQENSTIIKDLLKKRYNYDMEMDETVSAETSGE